MKRIETIKLDNVLPRVFAGSEHDSPVRDSQVWLHSLTLHRDAGAYLVEAESGTGKSSLCSFIYGNRRDYSGHIYFDDRDLASLSVGEWCDIRRRHIALLPQEMRLFPELTAMENIQIKNRLTDACSEAEIRQRLEALEIEHKADTPAALLSIGQQQRVAIARAIVNEPEVLLLDEPLAALDLKMRKDMQMELKEMHKTLGITFIYVTHDQEEALTLSDTIVVMSEGKIQQIGTPVDIYNEPINSFVADFIGESNILNGTMIQDKLVRFAGVEFECVDEGFGENMPVDVVVRPEDWYIFPDSDASQISGIVTSSIFKGVHYEMVVETNGYEFIVQDYHHFAVGEQVGLLIKPFDIHIMKKERVCNTFEGELIDGTHVEFLGCTFECLPVVDIEPGTKVKVQVDFKDIILQDNEEDGTLTGDVRFILYKGDHYHLTVSSDWGEDIFVDTNDVWDNGDHVGISIFPESIKITQIVES